MKKGFVLIEAILALALASTVFTALFILQGSVVRYVGLVRDDLVRIFIAEQQWLLFQYSDKKNSKNESGKSSVLFKKEIDYPQTTVTITKKSIPQKSALGHLEGLHAEWITSSWQSGGKTVTQTMVLFVDESEL